MKKKSKLTIGMILVLVGMVSITLPGIVSPGSGTYKNSYPRIKCEYHMNGGPYYGQALGRPCSDDGWQDYIDEYHGKRYDVHVTFTGIDWRVDEIIDPDPNFYGLTPNGPNNIPIP
jgi:hypothetical protein